STSNAGSLAERAPGKTRSPLQTCGLAALRRNARAHAEKEMTSTSRSNKKKLTKSFRVAATAALVLTPALGATAQQAADLPVERPTPSEARAILSTIPRHAMPLKSLRAQALKDVTAAHPNMNCPSPKLTNRGGPMISNVEVVAVWWGTGVDSTLTDAKT